MILTRYRLSYLLLCFVAGSRLGTQTAFADEDEASVHVQLQMGQALLGDPDVADATNTAALLGVGARATYATCDWYAFEIHATWGQLTHSTQFERPDQTLLTRQLSWLRLDTGIAARLGARFVPTLQATVGVQTRLAGDSLLSSDTWTAQIRAGYVTLDLVGTLGAGFDYRFAGPGDHWVVGGLVTIQHALLSTGPSFTAIGVMFHVAYYMPWFPGYS